MNVKVPYDCVFLDSMVYLIPKSIQMCSITKIPRKKIGHIAMFMLWLISFCKMLLLKQVYTKKSPKNQSDGPQQNHQKISGRDIPYDRGIIDEVHEAHRTVCKHRGEMGKLFVSWKPSKEHESQTE